MSVGKAYDRWADQYDSNVNLTRDLEARSLRETLSELEFNSCLEIGCGTGKNTEWLATRAGKVLAVDISEGMLEVARSKDLPPHVLFVQADITGDWNFSIERFDLVVFSLVLEHIRDLDQIFLKTTQVLTERGCVYIGELHPFKQYSGSKARFQTDQGTEIVECHTHHISDFAESAAKCGLKISGLREYFDEGDRGIPRILSLLLRKC